MTSNKLFIKYIRMMQMHMKRYSPSFFRMEIPITVTVRCHFIRMPSMKRFTKPNNGKDRATEILRCWSWGCKMGQPLWKTVYIHPPYKPTHPTFRCLCKRCKNICLQEDLCKIFTGALCITIKSCKATQTPFKRRILAVLSKDKLTVIYS